MKDVTAEQYKSLLKRNDVRWARIMRLSILNSHNPDPRRTRRMRYISHEMVRTLGGATFATPRTVQI